MRLTSDQREALSIAEQSNRSQPEGMAKWEIAFNDGKTCTMLSDQCRDRVAAFLASVERFGAQVKAVW